MSTATLSPPLVRGGPLGRTPVGRHGRTAPVTVAVPVLELVAARPEAPPVRLTRRGRLTVTVTLLVLALAVGLLSLRAAAPAGGGADSAAATSQTAGTAATSTLTVAPGDTLWAIAVRVDPHSDPRAVVERLRELNGLASTQLRAGEELVVPTG